MWGKVIKNIKIVFSVVVVLLVIIIGLWIKGQIDLKNQREEIIAEQEAKAKLEKRVEEVLAEQGKTLDEKSALAQELEEIMDTIAQEHVVLDSATIEAEMKDIGELATAEYNYTNVGTLDSDSKFFNTNFKIPGTTKTIVATMEGKIKAGIQTADIKVKVDEGNRTIIVSIPEAQILSHELDESSLEVFDESTGIFSKVTMKDSSEVRETIRSKSEEAALKSGLLDQAKSNAKIWIEQMLLSGVANNAGYNVEFK